ncbi:hypothetical protein [Egicoccus halophilus]|uniref:Uncharacterized protein n=1 Tax=Egicoccus halophilus TaxID=1670830 RepID=A0A8J3A913_9ACTN|nr:hypothetical protein [Egicoccus halophilus]GGI07227.1 hypothetical protein GCM10011354_23030 [Egicoccus halophilus]
MTTPPLPDLLEMPAGEASDTFGPSDADGRHGDRLTIARKLAPFGGCTCTPDVDIAFVHGTWVVSYGHEHRCRRLASLQQRN